MSEEDAAVVEESEVAVEANTEEPENEEQVVRDEDESNVEDEPSESSPEKEHKGVQKRIDELTRNWRETERDRDYWKAKATQGPPQSIKPDKSLEDFDYDEEKYQSYLLETAREAAIREAREEISRMENIRKQSDFKISEDNFSKDVDDYHSVTRNPSLRITQDMVNIMQEVESGPAILYYLGKNPEVADKLAELPPVSMAREIGKIETKLASKPDKQVTKAPPPAPKIKAVEPSVNINPASPDSDKMSTAEWLKRRNKQIHKG